MNQEAVHARIRETGIIPAIRVPSAEDALFAADAILQGGIGVVEVTTTVPGVVEVIAELRRTHPDLMVGAGTVIDPELADRCLDAGAAFLTSPGFDSRIMNCAQDRGALVIPGALSPSDIIVAQGAGARMIKLFPCSAFHAQLGGGPAYLRSLMPSFPGIAFIAAGGVKPQNAEDYIRAGAVALGIGEYLVSPEAVKARNAGWIRELCGRFARVVRQARRDVVSG